MSQPVAKRHDYDDATEAELDRWPGVTFRRGVGGKHYCYVLTYKGVSRSVWYPASPSDSRRGTLNHLATLRKVLRELGATRIEPQRSERQKRRVVKRERPALSVVVGGGRPDDGPARDPWAALAHVRPVEPDPEPQAPAEPPAARSGFLAFLRAVLQRLAS